MGKTRNANYEMRNGKTRNGCEMDSYWLLLSGVISQITHRLRYFGEAMRNGEIGRVRYERHGHCRHNYVISDSLLTAIQEA